jgi:P-type Ca2+ transporter type 2C
MGEHHLKEADMVLKELNSSIDGLSEDDVKNRQTKYGINEITSSKKDSVLFIFLKQFKSFIVLILFLTTAISYVIGHTIEFFVILFIILFIVLLNFFMEFKASKEMDSLIKLAPKRSKVKRNGRIIEIPSAEIVPGDILIIKRGDIVGADARLIEVASLSVDESALTGESVPIHKNETVLSENVGLSRRLNMVFSGTPVTSGKASAIVVAIGKDTEFGKISKLIKGVEKQTTPLQRRLDKLSKQIAFFAFFMSIIAFFVGLYHGVYWIEMLIFSMAIIVSGIPESLPTAVGICLAFGVNRMSKENAIVKNLPAVETLGTCTVICTDKTGTLTQNKMIVEKIFTFDSEVDVIGEGYKPEGVFLKDKKKVDVKSHETVYKALEIGLLCNNACLNEDDGNWTIDGEPTEGALVSLAHKAGLVKIEYDKKYKRVTEHAFDSNRKMMSVINTYDDKDLVHSKGAPEYILKKAKYYISKGEITELTPSANKRFLNQTELYASHGYRVLALAYKEHKGSYDIHHVEKGLIIVGLLAIRDPPDPHTHKSIQICKEAGIKTVMITGDNKITAVAIGKELGIYTEDDNILTGEELDKIIDVKEEAEFLRIIDSVTIFARTTPEHKLKIVESLQKKGHIVAMTGDGINDAAALKKADIGIAMGLRGSEVAKESSDLILKDDKFTTIAKAVESGRNIYGNIRKFIYYLLVGSVSEVLLILLAVIAGINLPLTALMVLFINLVTSEFPAIGLSLEKSNPQIMKRKPRDPKESILNDFVIMRIFGTVPVLVLGSLSLYLWEMFKGSSIPKAQTITFVTIILFELFHTFNTKSWNRSIFSRYIFSNKSLNIGVLISFAVTLIIIYVPFMQKIFGTVPLNIMDWLIVTIVSFSIIIFIELKKYSLNVEIKERQKFDIYPTRG